jgi:hypothetical protein
VCNLLQVLIIQSYIKIFLWLGIKNTGTYNS